MADGKPAAWLKMNGMNNDKICISMLVVDDAYKRSGVGSFAVRFAEEFAETHAKTAVRIQTTKDNIPATQCYQKQGYIAKEIVYAVGDGINRDGYEFIKEIK
jgi:ribosomal protein S18 acetylase RimI-like enzyme